MNLAVKLYETMPEDNENVLAGIDGKIPAEVIFNIDTPPNENYQIMSEEQYQAYLALIETELQAWKFIQGQMSVQEETV